MYEGKGNWTPFKTKFHIFGVGTWRTRERSLTYSWNYGGSKAPFFKVFLRAGDLKKIFWCPEKNISVCEILGNEKGRVEHIKVFKLFFIRLIKSSLFLAPKRFSTPISRRRWKRTVSAWISHKRASWAGILQTGGGNLPLLPFSI